MTSSSRFAAVLSGAMLLASLDVREAAAAPQDTGGHGASDAQEPQPAAEDTTASRSQGADSPDEPVASPKLDFLDLQLLAMAELGATETETNDTTSATAETEPVPSPSVDPSRLESMKRAPTVFPPRWNGNTLFATGAFTAALSMAMHAGAAYRASKECAVVESPSDLLPEKARELGIGDVLDSTFLSNIDLICDPAVLLPGAMRIMVPVLSAGSIAQIGVGGAFRGYKMGYEDTFFKGGRKSATMMIGVGGALMGVGAVLWASSRGSIIENRTDCETVECVVWYDFGTFQGSALLFTAGTGLVTQGMAYKRSREQYDRWKNLDVRPMVSRDRGGLVLTGQF